MEEIKNNFDAVEKELQNLHTETKKQYNSKERELSSKRSNQHKVFAEIDREKFNAIGVEKENFSEETVNLWKKKLKYAKKAKNSICFAFLCLIAYALCVKYFLLPLPLISDTIKDSKVSIIVFSAIGILLFVIIRSTMKTHFNKKIKLIDANENIIDSTKKLDEISKKYNSEKQNYSEEIKNLEKETKVLYDELMSIEERLFSIINRNTLIFYGSDKFYEYTIYFDGCLYDKIKAKNIIAIKLEEGIHNFKLDIDEINIFDGSIVRSFSFNTKQIIVDYKNPKCYIFECDGDKLKEITKLELEKTSKKTFFN